MQIGELFFALGFKTKGTSEAKAFEGSITGLNTNIDGLNATMDAMLIVVEKIAQKMKAMTKLQVDENRAVHTAVIEGKEDVKTTKDVNTQKTKFHGLLTTTHKKLSGMVGPMNAARLELMAFAGGLTYFVKKMSDAAVSLDKMNSLTGISTNTFQKLGDMAAQSGGNIDDLASTVRNFQQNSVNIKLGRGGDLGPWQFLGIDPHQDPLKILDQLSVKLKMMPTTLGTTLAKDLNLSDDMIYFLKNAQNLKPPSEETLLTDKEIKRLKDFNFYFNRIWEQSKRIMQKVASFITPIANVIVYGAERIGLMINGMVMKFGPMLDKITGLREALILIGGFLFAVFFPMTAIFLGLALALEDIYSYFKGDDSLTGRMIAGFMNVNDVIQKTISLAGFLIDTLLRYTGILAWMKLFGASDDVIANMTKKAQDAAILDNPNETWSGIGGKISRAWNESENGKLGLANSSVGMMGPRNAAPTVNNVEFNIDGSKDPQAVGQEVLKAWKSLQSGAYFQQPQGGY